MSLNKSEFEVLHALLGVPERQTQRTIAASTGLSLGTVNSILADAKTNGLVDDDNLLTEAGIDALEPYRVKSAIIMAAGLSSRFVPISYERPKGLLRVRGEVLIERQIEQLLERGITDITVIVGYKKEYFLYLKPKYGVRIVVNDEYATRNNNGSLYRVRDRLGNAYICSSDVYYSENPFDRYIYEGYYAAVHVDGPTNEWCMTCGPRGRITNVVIGGANADVMLGEAYFDRAFAERFVEILEDEYMLPETTGKLWETIYIEHIDELSLIKKLYPGDMVHEFDSLEDLRAFDNEFLTNLDLDIFDNIVNTLGCKREDIGGFYALKQGLTNLSCHFTVGDDEYVYRHPGVGTENMIDRQGEAAGLALAKELGLDNTFIYEDPGRGWKISHFVKNARPLDPTNDDELRRAMEMCRTLHESGATLERHFDFVEEGISYENLLKTHGPIDVPGYFELRDKVMRLKAHTDADGYPTCISHNDFFMLNFLIDEEGTMSLIDWEYAGMSDVANDFGTFAVCCELDEAAANRAIDYYFGREATFEERRHFWAFVVFAGWCWYIWSLEKEAEGDNVGDWLLVYYSYAVDYIDKVLAWYEEA